jgi:RNA polymerase sigma-70 factor (ECF subfamily)
MHTRPDSELISDGRNGDRRALSDLFERYYLSSMRIAGRILGPYEDARDVVQSAYLAAFEHFDTFRGEAQFKTWITQIVKNECFMHLRRPERRRVCPIPDEGQMKDAVMALTGRTPTPEDLAWRGEVDAAFCKAASELPKTLKDVYTLVTVFGFCVREAAQTLGLTIPATKTRLFRAQHRIRSKLVTRLAGHTPYKTAIAFNRADGTIAPTRIAA